MERKHAYLGGCVTEAKGEQTDRNGVRIGIVEGYLASWKQEDGPYPDRIVRGAFADSIADHRKRNNRQVRLNYMHVRDPIGGFPIETVKEDDRGLWGVGEINLDIQQGREAYSLAKQGVLVDMSVGYSAEAKQFEKQGEVEVRVLTKVRLYEASLVDEPMNKDAQVTAVKSAMPFANLPTAPEGTRWDAEAARERVLELKFREADATAAFLDRGRRFQIADVVDGKLVAVPEAVAEAAAAVKAAGVDDPSLLQHLDRYCSRMGLPSPVEPESRILRIEDVKGWTAREVEAALSATGQFTRSAAKFLASKWAGTGGPESDPVWSEVLSSINAMRAEVRGAL
jgi:HK97 family phage prohead protease